MRLLLPLAILATLLAGCVTPPASIAPGAALDGIETDGLVGGQYVFPARSTEPSIGADAKGALYMTGFAAGGATGRNMPTIWATFDGGQSFKDVGPKLPTGDGRHVNTNDPLVVVDYATGRVFMDDILPLSCGALSWSDDQGKTWTTNPYACGNSQVNDHQTLGVAKARKMTTIGYPNVVYRCTNNLAYTGCAMSYTGGLTFTPQVPAFVASRDGCAGLTAHLRGGADGKMYLPKADCPGGPTVMVTEDDGLSWSAIKVKVERKPSGHEMGFAVDENNAMYVTFESGGKVFFTASPDGGKTWLPERDVTPPDVTATMFNALALGAPGKVAIAYLGSTIPGGYEGKGKGNGGLDGDLQGQPRLPEWDDATWNAYIGVITDALAPDAPIETTTANDPADPLARGLCGGTRCHGMNDFIGITVDSEGRPWAAFVDVCTKSCVTDPSVFSDVARGMMGTLRAGPSLRTGESLPVLSVQPTDV